MADRIAFTPPMECLPVARIPEGEDWIYELKLDGYRAQAIRDSRGVRVLSRNGKDLTKKYPQLMRGLNDAIAADTALDGELVAFDDAGFPSFNALQNATLETNVVFFAFDVLVSEGQDVKMLPLRERKNLLSRILHVNGHIQLSEHFGGPLAKFIEGVKKISGEGVVAKLLDAPYQPGRRSGSWSRPRPNHPHTMGSFPSWKAGRSVHECHGLPIFTAASCAIS